MHTKNINYQKEFIRKGGDEAMSMYSFIKKKAMFFISVMAIVLANGGVKLCASNIENYKQGEIIVKYKQGSLKPQNTAFFTESDTDMEYIDSITLEMAIDERKNMN